MRLLLSITFLQFYAVFCSPLDQVTVSPTVTLDSATVTGINQGALSKFLGIPYAEPPVGELRFNLPRAVTSYNGSINATSYGPTCPQQTVKSPISLSQFFNFTVPFIKDPDRNVTRNSTETPESEDCLTINVIKPLNASADAKLPVVVVDSNGEALEVTMIKAHGLSTAWGFLASQEVQDAGVGNAGLVDQYVALQWVQKYISVFGGDPSKVTLWGQSAGAISASMQMLAYGGNSSDLFRGAFMQSGAPIPVGNLTGGQQYYDQLVNATNCTDSDNTLSCLRNVPQDQLKAAVDDTPNYFSYDALVLAWSPRADGVFLQDNPQKLVQEGKIVNVPVVSGNVDDEGTLFSLSSRNVTTDEQFREYVSTVWVPGASESELEPLWDYYPSTLSQGSPFNTSNFNDITPQYKRISAFQGDVVFQAPRRFFLQNISGKQKIWSYLSWRLKFVPVLGSFHGSDLEINLLDDYLVRFVNNLDPNGPSPRLTWPEYTTESPQLYTFPITGRPELSQDTYREAPMQYLMNLSLSHPL
ncbi:Lipase 4 [Psilocybe cubensis]|uniref:Lipase 4 n=1 Tax=Psilocybe cubensis TaxID=181762 RepID=A0ACB8HEW9_PSICU|nr:Lipase 4 [Psilocybe cubensis]KAH9486207.1 Lipase 4 [Psilocybe cubensis]